MGLERKIPTPLREGAIKLGADHGKAGASWVIDGNTSRFALKRCIEMDADGDPEWWNYYGPVYSPLSGNNADDMTVEGLMAELGYKGNVHKEILADLYEAAFQEAWHDAVMESCYGFYPPDPYDA